MVKITKLIGLLVLLNLIIIGLFVFFEPEAKVVINQQNTTIIQERVLKDFSVIGTYSEPEFKIEDGRLTIEGVTYITKIKGVSLIPVAFEGNTLIGKKYERKEEIVPGVIITYRGEDKLITHKVIGTETDKVLVTGNEFSGVEKVGYENIESIYFGVLYTR